MSQMEIEENTIDKNVLSIVIVARLVKQKAIDRLIRVHKRLIDDGIKHKIYVIGDGPERDNLEKSIKNIE